MIKYAKRGLLLAIPLVAVLFYFLDPVENILFPRCIFHSLTGYYCPGCGSQRAIHGLLHLNMKEVANHNFLFIPALLAIGYHFIHIPANKKFGFNLPNVFYMRVTPWIILWIVITFWILRNINWYPLNLLAPG